MFSCEERVNELLPGRCREWSEFRGQRHLTMVREDLLPTMRVLRDSLHMNMLVDVTAVDRLEYEGAKDRFEVVYFLLNVDTSQRLIASVFLNEPELEIDSVYSLWKSADWLEREVFDMFGIRFRGHPNMKRLLLPEQFAAHPLRKDYPVQGRGERHNFPVITRASS